MKKDQEMVREEQLVSLKSLKKLDEICKRHNISYWIAYGTLIGAIRHQGFIPWDDDLDVGMLREDYDKLCAVPVEEWGEDCLFCTAESDDIRQDKMFGRIFQKNTRIQSYDDVKHWKTWEDGKTWSTSLMCDIFVFDRVPDDDAEWKQLFDKICGNLSKKYKMVKLKYGTTDFSLKEKLKAAVKQMYGSYMRKRYKKPWLKIAQEYKECVEKSRKGKRIGLYSAYDPYLYEYDDVFPLKTATFEGMQVPIPKNYDKMLTDMYGNYMAFPPEDQRYHIDFVYIDLGDGRKYVIDPVPGSLGASEVK